MKAKNETKRTPYHRLDITMKNLWFCLAKDFRAVAGADFAAGAIEALKLSIRSFREYTFPGGRSNLSPFEFKAYYQLEMLFKRYRFANDLYSKEQVTQRTNAKYLSTLETNARCIERSWEHPAVFRVMQKARSICKEILGAYSVQEHLDYCRFGKRATVLSPLAKSYLDLKLAGPVSSSDAHLKWFKTIALANDPLLARTLCDVAQNRTPQYSVCAALAKTNVPKSYGIERPIVPDTTIGSYYTYGLGCLFQERLARIGLNIKRLQRRHGQLARAASKTRRLVTLDLSAASESIVMEHAVRVLPREWYNVVMTGRTSQVMIDKIQVYSPCIGGMGIGYTFTLQTLIFYCIIEAIRRESPPTKSSIVSVYGDDCIYPIELHSTVRAIFSKIGFKINEEKTFATSYFRESCGSDYFHGCNVRPAQPEGDAGLGRTSTGYAAAVYKLINGLKRRWHEVEIPSALHYLRQEAAIHCGGTLFVVPPNYPDYSGEKVDHPTVAFPWYMAAKPKYIFQKDLEGKRTLNGAWNIRLLTTKPDKIRINYAEPYLWNKLRGSSTLPTPTEDLKGWRYRMRERIGSPVFRKEVTEIFSWLPEGKPVWNKAKKTRERRLFAFVSVKTEGKVTVSMASILSWS